MRAKWIVMLILIGVVCSFVAPACASEREEVNDFYQKAVTILKTKNAPHFKDLVALVEKNPRIAERCLVVCDQKARIPGKEGEALSMIRDELQPALFLATRPVKMRCGLHSSRA
ncbi:MAG: hypothetical protein ACLQPD_26265 [Desulfomonilaceae bacterium]